MTNWIISSSVLILIVICMRCFLKGKISARLQYAMWIIVAIRLLMPFSFGSSILSVENLTGNFYSTTEGNYPEIIEHEEYIYNVILKESVTDSDMQIHEENHTTEYVPTESKFLYKDILLAVWFVGVGCTAIIFIVINIIFGRKNKKCRKPIYVNWCKIPVYVSDEVETPCLAGLFSPVIYVTKEVTENAVLLRHTVTHEMMHYKQGDSLWSILRCMCLAIHWYNPLVWWAAILSKKDAEFSCDEATIKLLGEKERKEYGKTLIQLSSKEKYNLFVTATAMTSGKRSIKERIVLIAKKPKAKWYTLLLGLLIACVAVGCTFTNGENEDNNVNNGVENGTELEDSEVEEVDSSFGEQDGPIYYGEAEEDKVCLAVMPDGISKAGGDYRFIIPEDQTKWMDGYKLMRSYAAGDGKWKADEQSMGVWIVFGDEWTLITDQGFIYDFEKRIEKKEAEDFYNLCMEESYKHETGEPVRPEDIGDIVNATIQIDGDYYGAYTITDEAILDELQKSLSTSTECRGGAACPFTTSLILESEGGKKMYTVYLASDTCSTWLSDGVYYEDKTDFIVKLNDMIAAREFVIDFTNAYFANDLETLQEYQLPTSSAVFEGYGQNDETPIIYDIKGLEACIDNFKSRISVEFKVSENADYYVYLEINIMKQNGEWKVKSYWLEQ